MKKHHKREFNHCLSSEHYNAADVNDKLIINFRNISHIMRFLYEGKGSQKRILIILNESGKITQRELTEKLGIKPGSVSEVIAKLEKDGYIIRNASEKDRRTADIELTAAGKQAASDAISQRNERHKEMFSCISNADKNTLLMLLEQVNDDWAKRYHNADKEHKHGQNHKGYAHHEKINRNEK